MENLFGTDGVRGKVDEFITEDFVKKIGQSVAVYIYKKSKQPYKKVLIAHDTRCSADRLEKALSAGLNEFGIDVVSAGVMPTPAVHYLVSKHSFDMAIIITASHNPAEYNGIKVITEQGYKLTDGQEEELTQIYYDLDKYLNKENHQKGKIKYDDKMIFEWANSIKQIADCSFTGMKVALDCANGASYFIAPKTFKELGSEVVAVNDVNNGKLINHECGSTYPEFIAKVTKENKCDLGFAFDGDADRVNVSFGDGVTMTGEELIYLCCTYLKKKGLLRSNKIITPIVTNCGVDSSLNEKGIQTLRVGVGGKNIQAKMLSDKISFGAEDNGHIVWGDYNICSDGLLTAVIITKMLKEVGDLRSMLGGLQVFYQAKSNVVITPEQKEKYLKGKVQPVVETLDKKLGNNGRIVVRPSGTEPLLRILVESQDAVLAEDTAKVIEKAIKDL